MNIIFRCDSSTIIGTGHVIRCLTLANVLKKNGINCEFICREHKGNLIQYIKNQGFNVYKLLTPEKSEGNKKNSISTHASWLGVSQEQDARNCEPILRQIRPYWLVVDHYALDENWEKMIRPYCKKIMVIDDLADRKHDCDLLLDQNISADQEKYQLLTPKNCQIFTGPKFALLRPEFEKWRKYSINRRKEGKIKKILITFGGVDNENFTCKILEILYQSHLPKTIEITVVMGETAPHLNKVKELVKKIVNPIQVLVDINNMAEVMANSDLAIGAAGSTSWERCCLGLPSLVMILAENQKNSAVALTTAGHAILIKYLSELISTIQELLNTRQKVLNLIESSSKIVNGLGAQIIAQHILNGSNCHFRLMMEQDLGMVRLWRNHPNVRSYMFNKKKISKLEHKKWFKNISLNKNHILLIFENFNEPQGFLNLTIQENSVIEWGFYLSPEAQGGRGKLFGKEAIRYCFETLKAKEVYGKVLLDNIRSRKFHEGLGFKQKNILKNDLSKDFCCYSLLYEDFIRNKE